MRPKTRSDPSDEARGFSMIELLIVVGLIVVMAAVALPNIAGYLRMAKVRGGMQQVAGEIQTARNKAIVKNVSPGQFGGVAFTILDANSYRFTIVDDDYNPLPATPGRGLAPLRDLPQGLSFLPGTATPVAGIGFDQLGRRCALGVAQPLCAPAQTVASMCVPASPRCNDRPTGNYMDLDPADATQATIRVRLRDDATRIERIIRIEAGGRVMTQR